jgi:hypothetical protein
MEATERKSPSETAAAWVSYLGMTLAMLGGATWPAPRWSVVALGLAVLLAAIAWARASRRREAAAAASSGERPLELARARITDALARTRALRESASHEALTSIGERAEAVVRECVEPVARAQESLTREHTFAGYARIMTPFASAERWLFRAWSAASDGHRPEVLVSLDHALAHLDEALEAVKTLEPSERRGGAEALPRGPHHP